MGRIKKNNELKVHLLKSSEFDREKFDEVRSLLREVPGPVHFVFHEIKDNVFEHEIVEWPNREEFTSARYSICGMTNDAADMESFPEKSKVVKWGDLINCCKKQREKLKIAPEELVLLLTNYPNDFNWFSGVNLDNNHAMGMRDFFVQTTDWNYYFGSSIDNRFPIVYEIYAWIFRSLLFSDFNQMKDNFHLEPKGCIMDFCKDKSEVILKMRTADICPTCIQQVYSKELEPTFLSQLSETLENIRKWTSFKTRISHLRGILTLQVTGWNKRILLPEAGNLELRLNPKERAIYLLFLMHPEGIQLSALFEHTEELENLYSRTTSSSDPETIKAAVALLTDTRENNMNEVLSRINAKIKLAFGRIFATQYGITGKRGEPKKILLNREFVKWEA